jgi:hypothetical protein
MKVWDFVEEFKDALVEQLKSDDPRWGDTWLKRTRKGQEERTIKEFNDYFDKYLNAGQPLPWLKIVGNSMICWIRERHPEIWKE